MKRLLQSRAFHATLGIVVSCALLAWLAVVIEWDKVAQELKSVHYWILIPATVAWCFHFLLRALRWRFLLPRTNTTLSIRHSFDSLMVGTLATFVLPLRAGEFVRPYMLSLVTSYSFSTAFVSVVIERFFDLSMVLLSFGIMAMFLPNMPEWVFQGAMILSAIAMVILLVIIAGTLFPSSILKIFKWCFQFLPAPVQPGLNRLAQDFLDGAAVLKSPLNLIIVVLLSVLVWLSCYLTFYLLFFLFSMEASVWTAICVAVIVALAVAAPSAPGFLGVYQTACVAGFALFGISKELAFSYSIVTHAHQFLLFVVIGVLTLMKYNLTLKRLQPKTA